MDLDNSVLLNILAGLVFAGGAVRHLLNSGFDLSIVIYGIMAIILLGYGVVRISSESAS